ncbi:hypothetical protein [Cryobacterium cryoconiti]|uniref:Uncharacterized protein n=1 Tax=Cryobacterium cryoconiti TaxID=1259239 RepID=A0A4Y8JWF7_9MICO|nr:hypothetical protein [Cryobacterium cryoconiti]TFD27479.1 hypothetical protein E3T49_13120 [Cryobacterium cryoconiti]
MIRKNTWITGQRYSRHPHLDVMDTSPSASPVSVPPYEAAIRITGEAPTVQPARSTDSWTPITISVVISGVLVIALLVAVLIQGPAA